MLKYQPIKRITVRMKDKNQTFICSQQNICLWYNNE